MKKSKYQRLLIAFVDKAKQLHRAFLDSGLECYSKGYYLRQIMGMAVPPMHAQDTRIYFSDRHRNWTVEHRSTLVFVTWYDNRVCIPISWTVEDLETHVKEFSDLVDRFIDPANRFLEKALEAENGTREQKIRELEKQLEELKKR